LGKGTAILCHKTAFTRILKEFSQPNFIAGQLKCPEKKIDLIIIGTHIYPLRIEEEIGIKLLK